MTLRIIAMAVSVLAWSVAPLLEPARVLVLVQEEEPVSERAQLARVPVWARVREPEQALASAQRELEWVQPVRELALAAEQKPLALEPVLALESQQQALAQELPELLAQHWMSLQQPERQFQRSQFQRVSPHLPSPSLQQDGAPALLAPPQQPWLYWLQCVAVHWPAQFVARPVAHYLLVVFQHNCRNSARRQRWIPECR